MRQLIVILLIILSFSCSEPEGNSINAKFCQFERLKHKEIYHSLLDSFKIWVQYRLRSVDAENIYSYNLDSLLCFNNSKDRFVACRHLYVNIPDATSDDLQYILGEKINNKWYFFKEASVVIPRSMVKGHPINQPLSYQQLHQIALKEIYAPYLKKDGSIDEQWFTALFEGPGWGDFKHQESSDWFLEGKRFKTRKEYFEFVHLIKVRNNWYGVKKDTISENNKPPSIN